jgi:hypothetical protein
MTLDERLAEIEQRYFGSVKQADDLLALTREYRDENAEAVRLLGRTAAMVEALLQELPESGLERMDMVDQLIEDNAFLARQEANHE